MTELHIPGRIAQEYYELRRCFPLKEWKEIKDKIEIWLSSLAVIQYKYRIAELSNDSFLLFQMEDRKLTWSGYPIFEDENQEEDVLVIIPAENIILSGY